MAKKSIQKVKVTSFTNKIWLLQIKSDVQKLERLPRRIINRNTGWQYWHCQASKGNLEHALKSKFYYHNDNDKKCMINRYMCPGCGKEFIFMLICFLDVMFIWAAFTCDVLVWLTPACIVPWDWEQPAWLILIWFWYKLGFMTRIQHTWHVTVIGEHWRSDKIR